MKRTPAFCLLAATIGLAAGSAVRAEDDAPQWSYRYTPVTGSGTTYRVQPVSGVQPVARRAIYAPQPAVRSQTALPPVGQQVVLRPVSWGTRASVAYVYPTAVYGQYVQAPGQPAADVQAVYGGSTTYPAGINPNKYAYAAPSTGGYYYASAYNSGYYTTGCYQANACCRCSRRRCTLFGGMGYGCGSGCYTAIPAPCPTTCAYVDPCGTTVAPPAYGTPTPIPSTSPAAPNPPTPAPSAENVAPPQPIEKKVTPSPQANLFPRIPGLPPDA
jgi:hypothetical protein